MCNTKTNIFRYKWNKYCPATHVVIENRNREMCDFIGTTMWKNARDEMLVFLRENQKIKKLK